MGSAANHSTLAVWVSVSSWLTSSPDYLIGLKEERRGDGQAQFLRGLQVDDQLEPMFKGLG